MYYDEEEEDDEDDYHTEGSPHAAVAAAAAVEPEEEIMAAVVVDDEDDDDDDGDEDEEEDDEDMEGDTATAKAVEVVVPAAMVAEEAEVEEEEPEPAAPAPAPAPTKVKTTPKKKKGSTTPKKGSSSKKSSGGGAHSSSKSSSKGGGHKGSKGHKSGGGGSSKKKKRKKPSSGGGGKEVERFSRISADRLDAAAKARNLLVEAAQTLPLVASDIHVRSFGRLSIEPANDKSHFSKANALYPVGYCCDRYEFSPIHGRVLKMRCSILDGKKIKEIQTQMGVPEADVPDGPVFRIMWGQAIDEDADEVEYPYDPYSMSAPLTSGEVDAVAIPTTPDGVGKPVIPRLGMRIKATFDRGEVFQGTITRVTKPKEDASHKKNRKRKKVEIEIQYDDGSNEIVMFPDPDLTLVLPGKNNCFSIAECVILWTSKDSTF